MTPYPLPPDEQGRLAELRSFQILDTGPEEALDDLVTLVAELCQVPIALITLIDDTRQWIKSKVGNTTVQTPRDIAFCSHAICQTDVFIVPDATTDERFSRNPLVLGSPNIRFYAGAPLITPSGHALGSLCVIDRRPRELKPEHKRILAILSRHVVAQLELRRSLFQRRQAEEALTRAHSELEQRVRERTAELNALLERVRAEDAERLRAEEAAHRRSDQLLRFEAALLKLATTPHPDLDSALGQITEVTAHTLGVHRVGVWLFDNAHSELRCRTVFRLKGEQEAVNLCLGAKDYSRWFSEMARCSSIAIPDISEDDRVQELEGLLVERGIKALLVTPIRLRGEVVGILTCAQRGGRRVWSQEEQDFAGSVSVTVALALEAEERRRLVVQLHALAAHLEDVREEERTGLARELHDELGQLLTALRMDVAWMVRNLAEHPASFSTKAPQRLSAMKELIDQAITSVQRISSELRPGILEELGLVAALTRQAREFEERSGIRCSFTSPEAESAIDHRRAATLYRAFQEALTNIARHAHASEVEAHLQELDGSLVLVIRDNGRGMPAEAVDDPSSFGLIGMRERALSFGGQAAFAGEPGLGTTVTVTIPIADPNASEKAQTAL